MMTVQPHITLFIISRPSASIQCYTTLRGSFIYLWGNCENIFELLRGSLFVLVLVGYQTREYKWELLGFCLQNLSRLGSNKSLSSVGFRPEQSERISHFENWVLSLLQNWFSQKELSNIYWRCTIGPEGPPLYLLNGHLHKKYTYTSFFLSSYNSEGTIAPCLTL